MSSGTLIGHSWTSTAVIKQCGGNGCNESSHGLSCVGRRSCVCCSRLCLGTSRPREWVLIHLVLTSDLPAPSPGAVPRGRNARQRGAALSMSLPQLGYATVIKQELDFLILTNILYFTLIVWKYLVGSETPFSWMSWSFKKPSSITEAQLLSTEICLHTPCFAVPMWTVHKYAEMEN